MNKLPTIPIVKPIIQRPTPIETKQRPVEEIFEDKKREVFPLKPNQGVKGESISPTIVEELSGEEETTADAPPTPPQVEGHSAPHTPQLGSKGKEFPLVEDIAPKKKGKSDKQLKHLEIIRQKSIEVRKRNAELKRQQKLGNINIQPPPPVEDIIKKTIDEMGGNIRSSLKKELEDNRMESKPAISLDDIKSLIDTSIRTAFETEKVERKKIVEEKQTRLDMEKRAYDTRFNNLLKPKRNMNPSF